MKIGENWRKLVKIGKLVKISEIGIIYNTPTYIYFWNSLVEAVKIFLVKSPTICNFTTLPDTLDWYLEPNFDVVTGL